MKIQYSPEAINDLHRVVEFVESENPYAARRIAVDLQEGMAKLAPFPPIGLPVLKAPDPESIRDLYISNYTVRYLLNQDTIYILRVWHTKESEKDQ